MSSNAYYFPEVLPLEIIQEIITYLDVASIGALRLTNRGVGEFFTEFCFKKLLRTKSIELTKPSLQSFQYLLTHPVYGPLVKDLKIVATVFDQTPYVKIVKAWEKKKQMGDQSMVTVFSRTLYSPNSEDLAEAEANIAWLQTQQALHDDFPHDEAVRELVSCLNQVKKLDSIELQACIIQGPKRKFPAITGLTNWYPVGVRAARTYCTTMDAISQSDIEFKALEIYHKTPRCAVPTFDIAYQLKWTAFNKDLIRSKLIEKLSLCCSNMVQSRTSDKPPVTPVQCHEMAWYGERPMCYDDLSILFRVIPEGSGAGSRHYNMFGIASLLEIMPNLKTFELCYRFAGLYRNNDRDRTYEILEEINRSQALAQQLRKVRLEGIQVTQESLRLFLVKHRNITDLALCGIRMRYGAPVIFLSTITRINVTWTPDKLLWEPIFEFLEKKMPKLEHLHLATLSSAHPGAARVNLHPVWEEHSKELEANIFLGINYVHTRDFDANDIAKGLKFRELPPVPIEQTTEANVWKESERMRYMVSFQGCNEPEFVSRVGRGF